MTVVPLGCSLANIKMSLKFSMPNEPGLLLGMDSNGISLYPDLKAVHCAASRKPIAVTNARLKPIPQLVLPV